MDSCKFFLEKLQKCWGGECVCACARAFFLFFIYFHTIATYFTKFGIVVEDFFGMFWVVKYIGMDTKAQMWNVSFLKPGSISHMVSKNDYIVTGQMDFVVVQCSTTNGGLWSNSQFRCQGMCRQFSEEQHSISWQG
jgi:hypothetical protein